jgi:hypothetical protein
MGAGDLLMFIHDSMAVSTRRRTADGYLAAGAHVARTGIQVYAGHELGRSDLTQVRVYRPEDEVFDRASLATLANKPITVDHPPEGVSAANWRKYAAGHLGGEILRDGDRIAVSLLLTDAGAISALEGGKQELSAGYDCAVDWTAGRTPAGEAYDAVQRRIRFNHVALVERGRAGSSVRIGDSAQPNQRTLSMMTDHEIRTMRDSVRGMPLADAMQLPIYDDVRGVSYGGGSYAQYCAIRDGAVVTGAPYTADRARLEASHDQMVHDVGRAYLGDRAPAHITSDPAAAHEQMTRAISDAWRQGR